MRKDISDNVPTIDKRQYMRFDARSLDKAVDLVANDGGKIDSILDISRGGIAVSHHNSLKVGEVFLYKSLMVTWLSMLMSKS